MAAAVSGMRRLRNTTLRRRKERTTTRPMNKRELRGEHAREVDEASCRPTHVDLYPRPVDGRRDG